MRCATAIAAALIALTFAACGESPEDEAREDGEQIGGAVRALFDAESIDQARTALEDLASAADEVDDETRDAVSEQVDTQSASLSAAVDAIQGGDLDALKSAVQEVRSQADSFRSGEDSVANEFWHGFEEGYDGD
jgi:hypothetical protein